MASPRTIRKHEIQFRKSLYRFSVTFSVVFLFGLATRLFLSSYPIKDRLLENLPKQDRFEIRIGDVNFQFRAGWAPVLGVAINRIDLAANDCRYRKLRGQDLLVRLSPWSLLVGPPRLQRADIDYLEIQWTQNCEEVVVDGEVQKLSPAQSSDAVDTTAQREASLEAVFSRLQDLLQKSPLRELRVEELQVQWVGKKGESLLVEGDLKAELQEALAMDLDLEQVRWNNQELDFLKTRWRLLGTNTQLKLSLSSRVREGQIKSELMVQRGEGFPTRLRGEMKKVPLSAVTSVFLKNLEFRYLWANCQWNLESNWSSFRSDPIVFSECGVDGPYGTIVIHDVQASLKKVQSFDIEIKELLLDEVLSNRRGVWFSGVFEKYGQLSLKTQWGQGQWKLQGAIEEAEFLFSNNNLRDLQSVKRIPFLAGGDASSWQAKLSDVELEQGDFDGEILVGQKGTQATRARVAIHRLLLNPRVYKLLLQSEPAELRIYGKGEWPRQGPPVWSAMVAAPELNSEFYELKNLKAKGESQEGLQALIKLSISEGRLDTGGPLLNWLAPTHLGQDWASEPISFQEFSVQLQLQPDRQLQWSRGYTRLGSGWQLSSEGRRDSERQVQGWLQWDRPDRQFLRWSYEGSFFDGRWTPESDWLKNWLNENPKFLKSNASIMHSIVKEKGS